MSGYILLGSPGSGKGTLAQHMKALEMEHIGSGDMLRHEVRQATAIGKQIQHLVQEGSQVPDELISQIILRKLEECMGLRKQFVLEGFPQTLSQLESLQAFLSKHPEYPVTMICVEIKPEIALKRMVGRMSCFQCESIFHEEMRPPLKQEECDYCQIPLIKRESDRLDHATQRIEQFERTTKKVMQCVRQYPHVFSVDGNASLQSVRSAFMDILAQESV